MSSPFDVKLNLSILPRNAPDCQIAPWRHELASAFTAPGQLLAELGLNPREVSGFDATANGFDMLVPRGYAALMERGNPHDPLLRQVLPLLAEREEVAGYGRDPVGDGAATVVDGLLQKYAGRALLLAGGACAIHCRYCFRRHFRHDSADAGANGYATAIARITADTSLSEIILSGGDPLLLDDDRLGALVEQLAAIGHLQRLRIHSRLPVVLPSRVSERLCDLLGTRRLATVMVIHANHPRELGPASEAALRRLARAGLTLLNQSVLLCGVNDRVETLAALSERLLSCGVLPYYLHQLDRVHGAAHFEVDDARARDLIRALRERCPGYLVPRLVREIPGARAKTRID